MNWSVRLIVLVKICSVLCYLHGKKDKPASFSIRGTLIGTEYEVLERTWSNRQGLVITPVTTGLMAQNIIFA